MTRRARIAFVLYTRNNAEYLQDFLLSVLLKTIETDLPNYSFHYYFYENDSTDNTVEILKSWASGRPVTIMSETAPPLPISASEAKTGHDFGRIARISAIRNRFLDKYREELARDYDYVWFLDTSIFVCAEDIAAMLKIIEGAPEEIAMVTCNTLETIENREDLADLYGVPPPSVIPFITTNHYYDTYAFLSIDNRSYYPNCTSRECKYKHCRAMPDIIPSRKVPGEPLEVRSAWGGCVIINAAVFKHSAVRWNTFAWSNNNAPCEHIYFCDMIRAFTGRKIVLAPNIAPFWIA